MEEEGAEKIVNKPGKGLENGGLELQMPLILFYKSVIEISGRGH